MKERINKCKKQITSPFASFFKRAVRKEVSPNVIIILFVIVAVAFIETLRRDLNLASALVAFGTLILAFFTSLSIMNSRDKENRDRKERLLNEIIEWAEDISRCGMERWSEQIEVTMKKLERERLSERKRGETSSLKHKQLLQDVNFDISNHLSKLTNSFKESRPRNKYIHKVAEPFGQTLMKKVNKLIDEVEAHITLLEKCQTAPNIVTKLGAGPRHKEKLDNLAFKVIEEATKIKTKDIS